MSYDKIFRIMDNLEVHVISECSHEMKINMYLTKHFEKPEFSYEYEEALSTLRVEIRIPVANVDFTFETDNEEKLFQKLFDFIPDAFSTHDLPMYLEKFKNQEEE